MEISTKEIQKIVELLLDHKKDVSYAEINSSSGHDAFLMENEDYFDVMKNFIMRSRCIREDLELISSWVKKNSSVLDLGCGDGNLLKILKEQKNVTGYGCR